MTGAPAGRLPARDRLDLRVGRPRPHRRRQPDPDRLDPRRLRRQTDAAWAGLAALAAQWADGLADKSDAEIVDAYFDGALPSDRAWMDATARGRWALDARDALQRYDGAVRDSLSCSGPWDIDPAGVTCPVSLVYGEIDPVCPPQHGEWYAAHLTRATLRVREGAAHGTTCFTGWAEHFAWLKGPGRHTKWS